MADMEPAPALPEEPEFGAGPVVTPAEKIEEAPAVEVEAPAVVDEVVPVAPLKARISPEGVVLSKCEFSPEGVILKVVEE
jgi:hypothetical protein